MNLNSYLTKRKRSQFWQCRLMIPKASRAAMGRAEFTKSLKVADRREAERLAISVLADWRAQIDRATRPKANEGGSLLHPSRTELESVAVEKGFDEAGSKLHSTIGRYARLGPVEFETYREELERLRSQFVRLASAGEFGIWQKTAHEIVAQRGWHLDEDDFKYLVDCLVTSSIDAANRAIARAGGNKNSFIPSEVVVAASKRRKEVAKAGETILELFEIYGRQRIAEKRKRPDTVDQDRKVLKLFTEFVGPNIKLDAIERTTIRDWRMALQKLPPAFNKRREFAGLSMREAVNLVETMDVKRTISPTTINRYLSTVSPFFDWCVTNGYVSQNPVDGQFLDIRKGLNPRPPFTTDQMKKILGSPLFVGFEADGLEHKPGDVIADDWRFWVPLICFFTGTRLSEASQLWIDDIAKQHDVWFFHIREDESRGQQTKSRGARVMPIHSKLIDIGFLEFHQRQVKRAQQSGDQRLFPELKPNARGNMSGTPSRFWRDYLEAIGIKAGGDGLGSHSFRHMLADQLRLADYLDNEIAVALGHKLKTTTSGYGRLAQGTVNLLHGMIESIKFEGISFDHLKQLNKARRASISRKAVDQPES